MEQHPSFSTLREYIQKYPKSRGAIYQAYNDIFYSQQWGEVQVIDAPEVGRVIISGTRPEQTYRSFVVPCGLHEVLSIDWISKAFQGLPVSEEPDAYLGIVSDDSSIVYYKITPGIVKPKN
ncbi:tRNA intron endonuclease [Rhizoctonia solani]|nr:tRNA intron endonuclease [Rhizoctonia solani]